MKAILFAGGKGTRLRPLTYFCQKVMIPLGKKQRPLLEYIIRYLKKHGIHDFVILVNYKKNQILDYFEDGSDLGVRIDYVSDREGWEGTGSAILNAREHIEGDKFIVYYGDILTNLNIQEMRSQWESAGTLGTLWLLRNYRLPVGIARIDSQTNKVVKFEEKPPISDLVNSGISMFNESFFEEIESLISQKDITKLDLSKDILPHLAEKGELNGYVSDAFWLDVGSIERFEKMDPVELNQILENMVK